MTTYLIQLSIGPVQGFISSARRTRDLWFGSWLLSEISKSVACHLAGTPGGKLVFPNPAHTGDLAPESPLLVSNIVLAEIACADRDAAQAALEAAKQAARVRWQALCLGAQQDVYATCQRFRLAPTQFIREGVWNAQRDDVLELYGAAVPLGNGVGDYATASARVRDLLAQRKNTRDFRPFIDAEALPKSSLDGVRSTVLQESQDKAHATRQQRVRAALGIEPAEQLDLTGLVKRVLGRERAFAPVARIAADAWLEKAAAGHHGLLAKVQEATRSVLPFDLATALKSEAYGAYPWLEEFPFDAQLVFRTRIEAAKEQVEKSRLGLQADETAPALVALAALAASLKPLAKALGPPSPYYALLLADGDRMGELIDAATARGADAHRLVSRRLAEFAQAVPALVGATRGVCVYSGGDDVLAMLRTDHALECAKALAGDFAKRMGGVVDDVFGKANRPRPPTLSVGIVIAHMLEPLGDVRELAVRAERLAKRGLEGTPPDRERNALALLIQPRSGGTYSLRMNWDDTTGLDRLRDATLAFADRDVPAGLPYELRDLLAREQALAGDDIVRLWPAMTARVLDRKLYGIANSMHWKKCLHTALTLNLGSGTGAAARIDELLCARWLAGRADKSGS